MGDPTGLTLPVAIEELFWGDAGIGLSIFGSGLGRRGHRRQRHARAGHRVGARSATARPTKMQLGAFCVSEPDAGSDVSLAAHPGRLRRGQGRVGAQRHQGVDHQRRHRRRPRGRRRGRPRAQGPGPGQLHRARRAPRASRRARSTRSTASGPSHTAEVVLDDVRVPGRCLLGGKEKLDEKLARAREAQQNTRRRKQPAMATFEATRPAVGAPGRRHRPRRLRVRPASTPRSARRSASRSS